MSRRYVRSNESTKRVKIRKSKFFSRVRKLPTMAKNTKTEPGNFTYEIFVQMVADSPHNPMEA